MFATFLVLGMTCWLAMVAPVDAGTTDQAETPPLFDNLGSLHHPITTSSDRAQQYLDRKNVV